MNNMIRSAILIAACLGCSCTQAAVPKTSSSYDEPASIKVEQLQESSALMNIYEIKLSTSENKRIRFINGASGPILSRGEDLSFIVVAELGYRNRTEINRGDVGIHYSSYTSPGRGSVKGFTEVKTINDFTQENVDSHIENFQEREYQIGDGEVFTLGSIGDVNFEIVIEAAR